MVGCLSTKLATAYMVNLVAKSTVETAGYDAWTAAGLLELWLSDSMSCTHTGLICLEKEVEPIMWLFSPFQTRPLGKELPSLLTTCTCPLLRTQQGEQQELRRSRKVWTVTHTGRDGMPLREVRVTASCSICKQGWRLGAEGLAGQLVRSRGLYAAVVPYFSN
jgi:hypothetical protein